MGTEKAIQIAVARADLIVSTVLCWLAVIVPLAIVLLVTVFAVRRWTGLEDYDPYLIDYDQPGVDITSEGPDDDYTDAWYKFGGDEQ